LVEVNLAKTRVLNFLITMCCVQQIIIDSYIWDLFYNRKS